MSSISDSLKNNWGIHLLALAIALLLVFFKEHYVPSQKAKLETNSAEFECGDNE